MTRKDYSALSRDEKYKHLMEKCRKCEHIREDHCYDEVNDIVGGRGCYKCHHWCKRFEEDEFGFEVSKMRGNER